MALCNDFVIIYKDKREVLGFSLTMFYNSCLNLNDSYNKYVNNAFYGLRPTSAGLIAAAGLSVAVTNLLNLTLIKNVGMCIEAVNWKGLILAVVLWIFTNKVKKTKNLHPIIFIGISAVVGIVFSF